MTTLYDQHKDKWDALAGKGFKNLAEAAKHFQTRQEMDAALDLCNAVHHWLRGSNASMASDRRAKAWLDANTKQKPNDAKQSGVLLLVACPEGAADKARKLLAFIGCDITEV